MRLFSLFLALALVLMIPFLFWGDAFNQWLTGEAGVRWLRGWGPYGWLAVIALLVGDVFLPIPATPVMSAAGYLYGAVTGGIVSATGSFLAGLVAYGLCRQLGRGVAVWLAGGADLARADQLFRHSGPWLVALSRWMPLLPEVVSCLAGMTRMPFCTFALALGCGCVPMGFAYAAIGAAGQDHPYLALILSAVVPGLLWLLIRAALRAPRRE
jgi:uncharacterized membrane protein YdjX (TVP38/TMEM64 family)